MALAAAVGGAGCTADRPDLLAGDGSIDTPCSTFADLVVEFKPAGGDSDLAAGMPALGPADGAAVSITPDGVLTLAFVGLGAIIDADGDDFAVTVVGTPDTGTTVSAYASTDGESFAYVGDLDADVHTIDLATTAQRSASYLRFIGLAGSLAIDSVEAVQTSCNSPAR
jgi:hypothetical protein